VMIHGVAHKLEGGIQIAAMHPCTGIEWCEYYGIDYLTSPLRIENIDAKILESIEANAARGTNGLDMGSWHGGREIPTIDDWCQTTHCRAGYAICLLGKVGFDLERKVGPEVAGRMIYAVSRPHELLPDFKASTEVAMADIRACAARQTGDVT